MRTPSDHSSVDNSPRTIAASHVLHRLLMPRHPTCALQPLTHKTTNPDTKKRCSHRLCNTQHTTTPRTPHNHHHTHQPHKRLTQDALDGPGRTRPPEKTTPQPARCLLRTQQCPEPHFPTRKRSWSVSHPATPQTSQGCGNNKKET